MPDDSQAFSLVLQIFAHARAGSLAPDVMVAAVDKLVQAGNFPLAGMLYRDWLDHRRNFDLPGSWPRLDELLEMLRQHGENLPAYR
ncbi:MAG TPA: hypothetical protein VI279_07920 [Rhodocyclaceae bacterium]